MLSRVREILLTPCDSFLTNVKSDAHALYVKELEVAKARFRANRIARQRLS